VTAPRLEWLRAFAQDRGTVSDLLAAARFCMAEACDEPPEKCSHPQQRMTPLEFSQWVESQVHRAVRAPIRINHHETLEGGQRARRERESVAS
jgi:hypothetical protein